MKFKRNFEKWVGMAFFKKYNWRSRNWNNWNLINKMWWNFSQEHLPFWISEETYSIMRKPFFFYFIAGRDLIIELNGLEKWEHWDREMAYVKHIFVSAVFTDHLSLLGLPLPYLINHSRKSHSRSCRKSHVCVLCARD